MNKLDSKPLTPSFAISPVSHLDPNPGRRLIVLFPASEMDTPELAHRIWEIARSLQLNVLLLSLSDDIGEEAQLRRKLITMAAIIKYPGVSTDIKIEHGTDWVGQVKRIWQTGDCIAYYEDHKVGFLHKPLGQVLRSKLDVPIQILPGCQPGINPHPKFWSSMASWYGSFAIIGGFLWAEVKIVEMPPDWVHSLLMYLFIFVVLVLLWFWNSLFS